MRVYTLYKREKGRKEGWGERSRDEGNESISKKTIYPDTSPSLSSLRWRTCDAPSSSFPRARLMSSTATCRRRTVRPTSSAPNWYVAHYNTVFRGHKHV